MLFPIEDIIAKVEARDYRFYLSLIQTIQQSQGKEKELDENIRLAFPAGHTNYLLLLHPIF
jgi:hypothetical protein